MNFLGLFFYCCSGAGNQKEGFEVSLQHLQKNKMNFRRNFDKGTTGLRKNIHKKRSNLILPPVFSRKKSPTRVENMRWRIYSFLTFLELYALYSKIRNFQYTHYVHANFRDTYIQKISFLCFGFCFCNDEITPRGDWSHVTKIWYYHIK